MPVEVLREITARLPGVRLFNFYGQTEMASVATVLAPEDQVRKAGSAGRPALNVETRVVDEAGRAVAAGQVGEIVHRSPHAMLGYWKDPARTAEAFAGGWLTGGRHRPGLRDPGPLPADGTCRPAAAGIAGTVVTEKQAAGGRKGAY